MQQAVTEAEAETGPVTADKQKFVERTIDELDDSDSTKGSSNEGFEEDIEATNSEDALQLNENIMKKQAKEARLKAEQEEEDQDTELLGEFVGQNAQANTPIKQGTETLATTQSAKTVQNQFVKRLLTQQEANGTEHNTIKALLDTLLLKMPHLANSNIVDYRLKSSVANAKQANQKTREHDDNVNTTQNQDNRQIVEGDIVGRDKATLKKEKYEEIADNQAVGDYEILKAASEFDRKINDEIIEIVELANNALGDIKGTKGKYSGINKAMDLHLGTATLASGALATWVLPILAASGPGNFDLPSFKAIFTQDNSGEMLTVMIILLMAAGIAYMLEEYFKKDDQDVTKDLKSEIQSQMTKFATGTPVTAEAIDNIRNKVAELALKSEDGKGIPAELSRLINKLSEKTIRNNTLTNPDALQELAGKQGIAGHMVNKLKSVQKAVMGENALVKSGAIAALIKTNGDKDAQRKLLKRVKIATTDKLKTPPVSGPKSAVQQGKNS